MPLALLFTWALNKPISHAHQTLYNHNKISRKTLLMQF